MPRNLICNLIVGAQQTGKTTFAKKMSDVYPAQKKVLVVCPDDYEKAWHSYTLIRPEQVKTIRSGKFRIVFDYKDKALLSRIVDEFKNGLLIWDDAKVYFNSQKKIYELEALIARRRQYNVDLMFMYHGFSTIPPMLWTYTTHLILFRTNDAFERSKEKTLNYEKMVDVLNRVNTLAKKNPYAKEIVPLAQ